MKAAVFRKPFEPLQIEDVQLDAPGPREVLVRSVAIGVCHSDLHYLDGHLPTSMLGEFTGVVLGHEGAGIVEAIGDDVEDVSVGDHVVMCLSSYCGNCSHCLTGRPNLCRWTNSISKRPPSARSRLSQAGSPLHQFMDLGCFAEMMLVHERSVVRIDRDIPLEHAALLSCGVLTGIGAAFNTARVRPASTVAVFGCGGVGLAIIQGAAIAGARQIIGIDIFDLKLEMAAALGATHVLNGRTCDAVSEIRELTDGRGVDYAFDALGSVELTRQAVAGLTNGGTATIAGVMSPNETLNLPANALSMEKRLQTSTMGSNRFRLDIPHYLELYRQGRLQLDRFVTHRMPLDDINEAFRLMTSGDSVRSVLTFS